MSLMEDALTANLTQTANRVLIALDEPIHMTTDQKLARLGELTTIVTLISPFPAFISCGKSSIDKDRQLSKLSYNFLLAMMVTNIIWLAYSLKEDNIDLIVINSIGTVIATSFVLTYLYVKYRITRLSTHIVRFASGLLFAILCSSDLTGNWTNGLIATSCSMTQYLFTLEGVKGVLNTRDPERVDLLVAVACIFNSYAWGCYAFIVKDLFVLIPNIACLFAGCINFVLYLWTSGYLKDSSIPIWILHKCCNSRAKMLPDKVKCEEELENEGLFTLKHEPADQDSHVLVERTERRKDTEED